MRGLACHRKMDGGVDQKICLTDTIRCISFNWIDYYRLSQSKTGIKMINGMKKVKWN